MPKLYTLSEQVLIPALAEHGVTGKHEDIVIRRENAAEIVRRQLTDAKGKPRFNDPKDNRVIYASPLVDVAGNMELVRETVELCKAILELTHWHIRLLSKSNLLPKITNLLAIFPMLALPFLIGGVSYDLFIAILCVLPALMLFALAVSLLASVLTLEDGPACQTFSLPPRC